MLMLNVSNMPSPDAPDGLTEEGNVEVRNSGLDLDAFGDHQKVPHWEIGEQLQILDVDRAVRLSGSMFVMYRGDGARLLRALIAYGLDRNRDAFEEVRPPTLVKTDTMIGSWSSAEVRRFRRTTLNATTCGRFRPLRCSLTSMFSW